jgi:hypothetical protein
MAEALSKTIQQILYLITASSSHQTITFSLNYPLAIHCLLAKCICIVPPGRHTSQNPSNPRVSIFCCCSLPLECLGTCAAISCLESRSLLSQVSPRSVKHACRGVEGDVLTGDAVFSAPATEGYMYIFHTINVSYTCCEGSWSSLCVKDT